MGQRQEGPPRPPGHRERSSGAGGGRQGADGGGAEGRSFRKGWRPQPEPGHGGLLAACVIFYLLCADFPTSPRTPPRAGLSVPPEWRRGRLPGAAGAGEVSAD